MGTCRFDIFTAGSITHMLSPQDASNPDLTSLAALNASVCHLCAVCNNYLVPPLPDIKHILEPGSLMHTAMYDNHDDTVSSIILRSATLIYLILSISQTPDIANQVKVAHRIRRRIEQQSLSPSSIIDPAFWILITDMESLTPESPERLWMVSRLLFVMEKLSVGLRSRLDEWFYYKLSGRRHSLVIDYDSSFHDSERGVNLKSLSRDDLDLSKILAAVWSEIGWYISSQLTGWKPPGTV
jgi:hypothetical protein